MKKLIIIAAVVMTAIMTNAATFNWNVYTYSGVTFLNYEGSAFTGTASLLAVTNNGVIDDAVIVFENLNVVDGMIAETLFSTSDTLTPEGQYDFYLTYTDGDYTFTSDPAKRKSTSVAVDGSDIAFSKSSGTWQSAAVPEPTSGLLLLLGMAGLALRRKRA